MYAAYLLLPPLSAASYAVTVLALFALGVWLYQVTEQDLKVHDHPGIVWDEIVGHLITMFMAPAGWVSIVAGFFLFRLFDIWKPFPIRQIERRIQGGFVKCSMMPSPVFMPWPCCRGLCA